jgi:mRNA interferase MazF
MLEYISAVLDWCKVAIFLRKKTKKILFKEGEIWWCSIGMNIGIEVYGKGAKFARPVLIFKKFDKTSFFGLPITSRKKTGTWYFQLHSGAINGSVLLAQARTFDTQRLIKRIETVNNDQLLSIQDSFRKLYNLSPVIKPENGGLPQT